MDLKQFASTLKAQFVAPFAPPPTRFAFEEWVRKNQEAQAVANNLKSLLDYMNADIDFSQFIGRKPSTHFMRSLYQKLLAGHDLKKIEGQMREFIVADITPF